MLLKLCFNFSKKRFAAHTIVLKRRICNFFGKAIDVIAEEMVHCIQLSPTNRLDSHFADDKGGLLNDWFNAITGNHCCKTASSTE